MKSMQFLDVLKKKTVLVCIIILHAFFFTSMAQVDRSIDSLTTLLQSPASEDVKLEVLIDLSRSYMMTDPVKGHDYALEAIVLAQKKYNKKLLGTAYNCAGGTMAYLSEYDSASYFFNQGLNLYQELEDPKGVADMAGNLGMVANMEGLQDKALKFQFVALKAFEEIPDSIGISNTNQQIASIYYALEDYERALEYGNTALSYFEELSDAYGVAITEGTLANIYGMRGDVEEAAQYHERSIEGFKDLESGFDLARELSNYATLKEQQGDLLKAITLSSESLDIYSQMGSEYGMAFAKGNIGSFYLTSAQKSTAKDNTVILPDQKISILLKNAQSYLEDALGNSERSDDLVFVQWMSECLSKVYEMQGKYEHALLLHRRSQSILDSLRTLETQKAIETLTTQREVLLKDKQIELDRLAVLKKRNERVYFIIGMGLLGLFLAMLYFNYRNKVKSNRQLKSLNGEITTVNKKLETKNYSLNNALNELQETQDQLIITEREKQKAEIRTRISQDIHDDISSGLTKIAWLAESFKFNMTEGQTHKLMPLVQKINKSSKDTVSKLGEIIWSTSPSKDNVDSFLHYLKDHIDSFLADSKISYTIDFPMESDQTPISPAVRRNLYLVLKEALHNSFKYSKATELEVRFSRFLNKYQLTISDNGKGFSPGDLKGSGNGLNNMKSRMEAIDGELSLESSPGNGVKIQCSGALDATA